MRKLGELVTRVDIHGPDPASDTFTYVDLSSVSAGSKSIVEPRKLAFGEAPSRARQRVNAHDVLVSTVRPNLNGVAMVPVELEGSIASTGFCVLRSKQDELHPQYLFHWVRSDLFVKTMTRLATGASYPAVSDSIVKSSSIPLPPLPEQRRIADILDRADNLRNQRRRALALCTELADATFIDTFSKNSVAKVTTFPLEEVVAVGTTVTYGIVQAGDEVPGGVPYIRTGDLVDGHINQERLRRTSPEIALRFPRSRVKSGEIVMSIRATVGTTAVVPPSLDGANLTQGTARISPGESVLTEYLLAYLRSAAAQNWLQAQVKGATFREITLGRLRQMPIPVPELGLQQNFRQRIQSLEHIRAQQETHLAKLDELFASLQHRAFQGEL